MAKIGVYSESVILRYARLNRSKPLNMGYLAIYPKYGVFGVYGWIWGIWLEPLIWANPLLGPIKPPWNRPRIGLFGGYLGAIQGQYGLFGLYGPIPAMG